LALPQPVPGLVIRYSYLWLREHEEGAEEGIKDRPCAIVAAVATGNDGKQIALVLPITHSPPVRKESALELPQPTKFRLGLDSERSWIVIDEWNEFVWPGPDLRRVPGDDEGSVAYGILPPDYFAAVRDRFLHLRKSGQARPVLRTE
jgi:hypothetical protein